MIQIDIPMPRNCLECRFSWAGDSCTYCIAQCYHKPEGGFHLHKIKHTYKGREEQEVWREETCPLVSIEPRMMTLEEVQAWNQPEIWLESIKPDILGNFITPMTRIEWAFFTSIVVDSSKNPPVTQIVNYGKTFRCWTQRPTDEQREVTPWQ